MWIIVISHLLATSCWRNSLKLNYDACPFIKCRWQSSDRFLQWHLRKGVEKLISYSWWRILTVYWLKEWVDTLLIMMHLSVHLWFSLWSSLEALWEMKKMPFSIWIQMCMMSEIKMKSRRHWAPDYSPLQMTGLLSEDHLWDTQP